MQIVIPMAGFGERFRRAGYKVPKPLIEVEGRPIIEHIVRMFPEESGFVFVCNREQLADPQLGMRETLQRIAPSARIAAIDPHKLGPIHTVLQASEQIDDREPTVVNYCDFCCLWDYAHFKRFVLASECHGAIPCYRNFHPHTLWSQYYAYVKESEGWISDIQEKQPFTNYPNDEFASSGTYYFRTGARMKATFEETVRRKLHVNGEYYVSMAYKPMLEAGDAVAVYELPYFMQWGTPEDLRDYEYASKLFRKLADRSAARALSALEPRGALLLPMAGAGKRFADEGYAQPKPLIPVSGVAMVRRAQVDLPPTQEQVFVLREDLPLLEHVTAALEPGSKIVHLRGLSEGQACSCLAGLSAAGPGPLTIASCDTGLLYDARVFQAQRDDPTIDVMVWAASGYPGALRRPEQFGWVDQDAYGVVRGVSVKKPLSSPETDPVIVGAFTFKRSEDFARCAQRMLDRDARVNGEFYVDTLINDAVALGLCCVVMPVEAYVSWGTPAELRTFEYWRDCFHAWNGHPYRLHDDARVDSDAIALLIAQSAAQREPYTPAAPKRKD